MAKSNEIALSLLCLVSIFFAHGNAIVCYIRSGSTDTSNGTAISCTGYTYCYSYTKEADHYAGCSTMANVCAEHASCVTCTTDYCNSVTPSSISCFARSSDSYRSGSDGTRVTCATGVSTCFSASNGFNSGGCGSSSSMESVTCNSSYCNSASPSSISCYLRFASLSIFSGSGDVISCSTGFSTCYSYTDASYTYASCGRCSTESIASCVTCSTDNCNTHMPNTISCFYRSMTYFSTDSTSNSNGTMMPCSTGVSTCFSYMVPNPYWRGHSYFYSYSGCGVCSSNASATYGCKTCNSSNCNHVPSEISLNARSTDAPRSILNETDLFYNETYVRNVATKGPYGETTVDTRTATRHCYQYYGIEDARYKTRINVSCYSNTCYEYRIKYGKRVYFSGGCGNGCAPRPDCRSCSTDYCNSATMATGAGAATAAVTGFVALALMKLGLMDSV